MTRELGLEPDRLTQLQRLSLIVGGSLLLAAGAVAVYTSKNGVGAAALVAVGAVAGLLGVLGRHPTTIDAGGVKVDWTAAQAAKTAEQAADQAEAAGQHELAVSLRQQADILAAQARAMARDINEVRATMPSSWERTAILEEKMDDSRNLARVTPAMTAEIVAEIFSTGGENRVVALAYIQARPDLYSPGIVEDAIARSRSAFEQYHAMKTARDTMRGRPDLPLADVRALRVALDQALDDPRVEGDRRAMAAEAVAIADALLAPA